jgi:alpha-glucuronidase
MCRLRIAIIGFLLLGCCPLRAHAQAGGDAWLQYARLGGSARAQYESLPSNLVVLGDSALLRSAQEEMMRGVEGMTGKKLRPERKVNKGAILLGTLVALHAVAPGLTPPNPLESGGFWLVTAQVQGVDCLIVTSSTERGVLYGVFALLSKMARSRNIAQLNESQQPGVAIRWINQWDNLNGTIERGPDACR